LPDFNGRVLFAHGFDSAEKLGESDPIVLVFHRVDYSANVKPEWDTGEVCIGPK
jgi:hypothetical protein